MKSFFEFKRTRGEIYRCLLNTKKPLWHRKCWDLKTDDAERVLYVCLPLFLHSCLGVHLVASGRGRFLGRWTFDVVQCGCSYVTIIYQMYWRSLQISGFSLGDAEDWVIQIWSLHYDVLKVWCLCLDWLFWKSEALRRNSFNKDCIWGAKSAWHGAVGATGGRKGKNFLFRW